MDGSHVGLPAAVGAQMAATIRPAGMGPAAVYASAKPTDPAARPNTGPPPHPGCERVLASRVLSLRTRSASRDATSVDACIPRRASISWLPQIVPLARQAEPLRLSAVGPLEVDDSVLDLFVGDGFDGRDQRL